MDQQEIILKHSDILELIPHLYPFLLVGKVKNIIPSEEAVGIKAITSTEPYLDGHFPGFPIMPGVLIIEAMAQTAAVMISHSAGDELKGMLVYFTTIENARFRAPSHPGDVLEMHVKRIGGKSTLHKFEGTTMNNGVKVASASFSAMIVPPNK